MGTDSSPVLPWRRRGPRPRRTRPYGAERVAPGIRQSRAPQRGEHRDVVPFTAVRRRTAEHMVRSKATAAHAAIVAEVDFEAVARVRRARDDEWRAREGFGLTYLPFIARAVVDAIDAYPEVSGTVTDDALVVKRAVHLGIAVDLGERGLVVPVIRDAPSKRLRAIAREVADLAARARARQLSPDDVTGGTFTITNPGPFGTHVSVPIINQPQVAILATDRVAPRVVVVESADGEDGVAVHQVGNLTLGFDRRALDVRYAASFLACVREIIEGRPWAVEL